MTLPVEVNPLLTGGGGSGYNVSRSVRLRSSASAYFNRTPATATNRKTFTWSGWVKRSNPSTTNTMLAADVDANNFFAIWFREEGDNGRLEILNYSSAYDLRIETTQVFRDVSAWYHVVVAIDTTQATSTNRVKIYINGSQVTALSTTTYPSLNFDTDVNTINPHKIGVQGSSYGLHNGYLTEINFIDGQALTPSSFGGYNSVTGGWEARKYTGTYGANGFYLNFSDNSAATAAAIGKDSSGNGNNWTPNNISVTAGVTYDSMIDVPTPYADGGNGRGNYPTWNPLTAGALVTFSQGNLNSVSTSASAPYNIESTIKTPTSGKWYAEVTMTKGANNPVVGIGNNPSTSNSNTDQFTAYRVNATYVTSGMGASSSGTPATFTTNDVIGIAYDADAGTLVFYKNGTLQSGGFTGITAGNYSFIVRKDSASGDGGFLNCGQRPFSYTPPSGFKALHTGNLPAAAIAKPNKNFDVSLYTGNGTSQSITNTGGFAPDLVWLKARSAAYIHVLVDSVRGTDKVLSSAATSQENFTNAGQDFTSFNSNGFSVGTPVSFNSTNASGATIVGWQWKAGGTAVSNNSGTIVSQVSANASAGFSVVTYTGTGANATVGHGLGVAPKMIIVKRRNAATDWFVWHTTIPNTDYLQLNTTAVKGTLATIWNSTAPSSSVFSLGSNSTTNGNTDTHVAYCFSEIAGYSKMGSYNANASVDGPFVYTGFRPKFVMIKASGLVQEWVVMDTSRDPSNVANQYLLPNSTAVEGSGGDFIDFLSNGFKIRDSGGGVNYSAGQNYIYIAFAETPFKNALAR
jgi:hypothetical protein